MSMHRIRSISNEQWEIVDDDDQVRFVGTPGECEALLDSAENLEQKCSWLQSLLDRLLHPRRHEAENAPGERPTSIGR